MPMLDEKYPMQSKKFIAYLLAELTWKAIIVFALILWKDQMPSVWAWGVLLAVVVTAGFIEIGYILSQAALDRYIRIAEIAADEVQEHFASDTKTETQTETQTHVVSQTKSEETS